MAPSSARCARPFGQRTDSPNARRYSSSTSPCSAGRHGKQQKRKFYDDQEWSDVVLLVCLAREALVASVIATATDTGIRPRGPADFGAALMASFSGHTRVLATRCPSRTPGVRAARRRPAAMVDLYDDFARISPLAAKNPILLRLGMGALATLFRLRANRCLARFNGALRGGALAPMDGAGRRPRGTPPMMARRPFLRASRSRATP